VKAILDINLGEKREGEEDGSGYINQIQVSDMQASNQC